jgi:hypothetical protein
MTLDINALCKGDKFKDAIHDLSFLNVRVRPSVRGVVPALVPELGDDSADGELNVSQGQSFDSSKILHMCCRAAPPPTAKVTPKANPLTPSSFLSTESKTRLREVSRALFEDDTNDVTVGMSAGPRERNNDSK